MINRNDPQKQRFLQALLSVVLLCLVLATFSCGRSKAKNWVSDHAVRFDTAQPGSGFKDLMPVKGLIGSARIVGLGEATHGTHEFFAMKHRMLEFLVEEMGFNAFVIEANGPESEAINEYVHSGKGDPKKLLQGLYFWTWNTQEVLDMIEWMRKHNQTAGASHPVSFYGMDAQFSTVAAEQLVSYLTPLDPGKASTLGALCSCAENYAFENIPDRIKCQANVLQAYNLVQDGKAEFIQKTGLDAYVHALHNARVIYQTVQPGNRDRWMAENLDYILDQLPAGSRVMLWAHNGHIRKNSSDALGALLAKKYGKDFLAFGFDFYEGSFQAITSQTMKNTEPGRHHIPSIHTVRGSPKDSYESLFHSLGLKRMILDLRASPPQWMFGPHPMRWIGGLYNDADDSFDETELVGNFDILIYFDQTGASHPLAFDSP